jgi:hypothetical protein
MLADTDRQAEWQTGRQKEKQTDVGRKIPI